MPRIDAHPERPRRARDGGAFAHLAGLANAAVEATQSDRFDGRNLAVSEGVQLGQAHLPGVFADQGTSFENQPNLRGFCRRRIDACGSIDCVASVA
jgi:hypothetical protein